jgi:photosystem II stability/assembly factor-like uncharacterized protein
MKHNLSHTRNIITGVLVFLTLLGCSNFIGTSVQKNISISPHSANAFTWHRQWSGLGEIMNDVWFINATHGFIATTKGFLLRTTDGGANWARVNVSANVQNQYGNPQTLNCIYFFNTTLGFACGYEGKIIKTTDGGNTWRSVGNNSWASVLWDMYFLNGTHGWAIGANGHLKTVDGGETWIGQSMGGASIWYINATHGFLAGGKTLYRTVNGGQNWTEIFNNNGDFQESFNHLYFPSSTHGYLSTRWKIYYTNDSGATWVGVTSGFMICEETFFINNTHGFAVGSGASLYYTTNAGASWTKEDHGFPERHLKSVFAFLSGNTINVWACGEKPDSISGDPPPYWGQIISTIPGGTPPTNGYPQPLSNGANNLQCQVDGVKKVEMDVTATGNAFVVMESIDTQIAGAQNVPPNLFFGFAFSTNNTAGITWPVTIRLYYTDAELQAAGVAENSLQFYYFNSTSWSWQLIGGTVHAAQNYLEVTLTHFSTFAMAGTGGTNTGTSTGSGTGTSNTGTTSTSPTTPGGVYVPPMITRVSGIPGYPIGYIILLGGILCGVLIKRTNKNR